MDETLRQLRVVSRTVVVDVSYPYSKHEREALRGRSTAEAVQVRLPSARVFKGWNHVHARHPTDPEVDGIAASVLTAGDDPEAKDVVFAMARDMGFHPVDAGSLRASRDLEKLVSVMLFVRLGPVRVLSPLSATGRSPHVATLRRDRTDVRRRPGTGRDRCRERCTRTRSVMPGTVADISRWMSCTAGSGADGSSVDRRTVDAEIQGQPSDDVLAIIGSLTDVPADDPRLETYAPDQDYG